MGRVYTFHSTARGYMHITKDIPCEDSSDSFRAEDGSFFICAVADGHGADACFRSREGSKIATDVAMENLRQFAETILVSEEMENRFYLDLSSSRYRQMAVRQLTDTIVAQWNDRVLLHFQDHPPTEEEQKAHGQEQNISHIYGTTLIAALQLPKCLLLLQQGDGRCDVFFADGRIEQPIPWDERCQFFKTTSLCDRDAAERFRSCVIDLTCTPVIACCLGSDGVEDAYRDTYDDLGGTHRLMGGVHTFNKDLLHHLAEMGPEAFESYLESMLPEFSKRGKFSKTGSGDDVSVAGIVDLDCIGTLAASYQKDATRYALEESLFWQEDALRGKTRKREILRRRIEQIRSQQYAAKEEEMSLRAKFQEKEAGYNLYKQNLEKQKRTLEGFCGEANTLERMLTETPFCYLRKFVELVLKCLFNNCKTAKRKCEEEEMRFHALSVQLEKLEKKLTESSEAVQLLEQRCQEAEAEYQEYNQKYEAIEEERDRIREELASLDSEEQAEEQIPVDEASSD